MKKNLTLSNLLLFIGICVTTIYILLNIALEFRFKYDFYVLCGVDFILLFASFFNRPNKKNIKYVKMLEKRVGLWNTISCKVKGAGTTVFNDLDLGILVIDKDYNIKWSNKIAKNIFVVDTLENMNLANIANSKLYKIICSLEDEYKNNSNMVSTMNKPLDDSLNRQIYVKDEPEKTNNKFKEINNHTILTKKMTFNNNIYCVEYIVDYGVIYLKNITEFENLNTLYENRVTALGYINIDNIEESLSKLDVQEKSDYTAQIITTIASWADEYGMFVRAFNDSRYILICDASQFKKLVESKFPILDEIKGILKPTVFGRITMSAGIVCEDIPIEELSLEAQKMLDLALNRGGDQVICKYNGEISNYGATTEAFSKNSNVEMKYYYVCLEKIIKESSTVFSIGHRWQDADSFASALALSHIASACGKESYIILDENSIDKTVRRIINKINDSYPTIRRIIKTPEEVSQMVDDNSLLVIVDCQSEKNLFLDSKIYNRFKKVCVIDHHRKNEYGTVDNPYFYYSDPSASSCVEIIFNIIQCADVKLDIIPDEATWMMLGLVVDTNNFTYRTSASTFEVASYLNKYQADMSLVKEYLKQDFSEKVVVSKIVNNVEVFDLGALSKNSIEEVLESIKEENNELKGKTGQYAMLCIYDNRNNEKFIEPETISKVADELLSIKGADLGVCCAYTRPDTVKMSARSFNAFNCQVLMEKLGGGGHKTSSAAEIKGKDIFDVKKDLLAAIKSTLEVEENMKVILKTDIKGKGAKDDIIEVPLGYGRHLIEIGYAVAASAENLNSLEQQREANRLDQERILKEKLEIKSKIENTSIILTVKISSDGRILGNITTKHIADALETQLGIKVDKRKITFKSTIAVLGEYQATISLHKDVVANISIIVTEAKKN